MFLLRQTTLRAAVSVAKSTSSLVVPKARTFVSVNQLRLRPAAQWTVSAQKRFATSDTTASERPAEEKKISENEESLLAAKESVEAAEVVSEVVANAAPSRETLAERASSETDGVMEASDASFTGSAAGAATARADGPAIASTTSAATESATRPRHLQGLDGRPSPNNILYVGNILFTVTEQSLEDYFARFGQITKTRIVYDNRGLSKGFGYVEFENIDNAVRAVDTADQQVFQGRRLAVQFHRPRQAINRRSKSSSDTPTKTLFIGNMSFDMSDKEMSDLFRDVRNVLDVRIAIDRRTGQPRGFAHADFIDAESASKALEYLQGKEVRGRQLRVDYSVSTPRTARQEMQASG